MSQQEKYRKLCEQYHLPVFFQPWWLDVVSEKWDIAIVEHEGKPLAVWPFSIENKLGVKIIRNPVLTPYLGPFFIEKNIDKEPILEALWRQFPKWDFFDVQCLPEFSSSNFFLAKGFSCKERTTYIVDLSSSKEVLFKNIKESRRSLIRKAERELEIDYSCKDLESFYRLHKATFINKKLKYAFSKSKFLSLMKTCLEHHAALASQVQFNGKMSAIAYTPYDLSTMYFLLSAFDHDYMHPGGVSLLIWEAIKTAKDKGLHYFDFEGSMDPGIAMFFKSFGGEKKSYLHFTNNQSIIWRLKNLVR